MVAKVAEQRLLLSPACYILPFLQHIIPVLLPSPSPYQPAQEVAIHLPVCTSMMITHGCPPVFLYHLVSTHGVHTAVP